MKQEQLVNRQTFLHTLDLYLAELAEDPCFQQARRYYATAADDHPLSLDRWGSPAPQLRADARAGAGAFLAETAEAIQRAPVLVWQPARQIPGGRFRPDRFAEAAAQIIAAFDTRPTASVIITLEQGVRQGLPEGQRQIIEAWRRAYRVELDKYHATCRRTGVKGYKEISLFTFVGFLGGLGLGALLDALGFSTSAIGEWLVRTISGEGEDLSEGAWVLRSRLRRRRDAAPQETREEPGEEDEDLYEEGVVWFEEGDEHEAAEAYGAGKVAGMAFPWVMDAASRLAGVDVRAPEGSYVAYFYSLADQLFATINGLRYHVRRAGSFGAGVRGYFRDPVMVTSFAIVTLPFPGLYLIRLAGWRPDSLFLAAFEAVLLNLCWLPPLAAWIWDWRLQRGLRQITAAYAAQARAL